MTVEKTAEEKFDDVLMAMDVVDTLRQSNRIVERELTVATYDTELISKLRNIYASQGIEVPDHVLKQGVDALREDRFVYEPAPASFSRKWAEQYVANPNRFVWMFYGSLAFFLLITVGFIISTFGILTGI